MRQLWLFLTNKRVLTVAALVVLCAWLVLDDDTFEQAALWGGALLLALLAAWCVFWTVRYLYRRHAALQLGDTLARDAEAAALNKQPGEVNMLRKSMIDAIATIKTSKLGLVSGAAALYELPWYMIIGNPSAGKSSAIANSGLHFPIAGNRAVHGVAGTRNCDWFFTTDGILLDTAGRYAVEEGERSEWFSFLALLRKYRRRAPINGIMIAVSVAELISGSPADSMELAKRLRTRVQEMTERLGVFAPVYVIFTKVDLIAGFRDFFEALPEEERKRAWGATIRYNRRRSPQDVLAFFDQHLDELHEGLKEMSLAQMDANRSAPMRPGVFTFPLEFASIKAPLRAFLATLFEENIYQFRPVFRGFYFVSALQEGEVRELSAERVAGRFELDWRQQAAAGAEGRSGYFLNDLFRKIVFADKDLVARYTSPTARRIRIGCFVTAAVLLGGALGAWTWSYHANRQLLANVQADVEQVRRLQAQRIDLASRLEALEILQDRLEQLERYRSRTPLALGFGLYQGDKIEHALRTAYFHGMGEVMLRPVLGRLEAYLVDVNAHAATLSTLVNPAGGAPGQPYQAMSPESAVDAYAALKTYLILENKALGEPSHLHDQLTRFWRSWLESQRGTMPREKMVRSAERLMSFYLSRMDDPGWPRIAPKLNLRDTVRSNLNRVMRGEPARARVYADIKARAATRHPTITVARIVDEQDRGLLLGSQTVSGAFTRAAWDKFVAGAIREAARKPVDTNDFVLNSAVGDDLTLSGSPEQIEKALTELYKAEYIDAWRRFVQGVAISELDGFDAGVQAMNRLGDPQASPIARLLRTIQYETAWDTPGAATAPVAKGGLKTWLREKILRRLPSAMRPPAPGPAPGVATAGVPGEPPGVGPVGRAFSGVGQVVGGQGQTATLLGNYLESLSRLRSRLNQIKNQGNPGPGAKQLMQQTLGGGGSELADALKYVDEHMLTGMSDAQRQALRPILVRPLMQTFAMLVEPSESEINKTWQLEVLEPFQRNLQSKYPFTTDGRIEASPAEIGLVFGPEGQIARFVAATMGPLVMRRGDTLAAQTWADMGVRLAPAALAGWPRWLAPVGNNGVPTPSVAQTVFQLLPMASPGALEYTIEVDGQQLRYRNTPPAWVNMVHPGPGSAPGARISAITEQGRSVELFNARGQFGLRRMIDAARSSVGQGGVFDLHWSRDGVSVAVALRITSTPGPVPGSDKDKREPGFKGMRLPGQIVGKAAGAGP